MSAPYAITHNGKAYSPDGLITDVNGVPLEAKDAEAYNKALEEQELAWLKTHPEKLTLYMKHPTKTFNGPGMCGPIDPDYWWKVTTWMGTVVCECAHVGPHRRVGFGRYSYRRAVTAVICGCVYHGWYMESSGDYVRLKKAKRQKG